MAGTAAPYLFGLTARARFILFSVFLFTVAPAARAQETAPGAKPSRVLTVEQCIQIGLRKHPALRVAASGTEAAHARIGQANSFYYPRVLWVGEYFYGTSNGSAVSFLSIPDMPRVGGACYRLDCTTAFIHQNNWITALTMGVPIYDFGRTRGRVREQEGGWRAAQAGERTVRDRIAVGVKRAYYGVLAAKSLLEAAKATVTRAKRYHDQAREMLKAGTRPEIEVHRTRAESERAGFEEIRARANLESTRLILDNAMGIDSPPGGRRAYEIANEALPGAVIAALDDLIADAFRYRPEISEVAHGTESVRGSLESAEGGFYPWFSGSAAISSRGVNAIDKLNYDVGLVATFPLFEGFLFKERVREANGHLSRLTAVDHELRQRIEMEVKRAYYDLLAAGDAIPAAKAAEDAALKNLEFATGRYDAGVTTIIEVVDAETLYVNTQSALIRARYEYQVASADLERAVGRPVARRPPRSL